jgi:hypothetical protein
MEVENTNAIATVEISGTAEVGQTLTAVAKDAAGDEVDDAEFQWVSGTSDYSTNSLGFFQAIEGATGSSYTITAEDSTNFIRVKAINDATKEENYLFWGAVYSSASKWAGPSVSATLTAGAWANGNLAVGGTEWFKFTATASTNYIHVIHNTLTDLWVQVYNSSGGYVTSRNLDGSTTSTSVTSLTSGETYFVKVWPYSSYYSGTYQIAFSASSTAPAVTE